MKVEFAKRIDDRHSIEVGWSTWNPDEVSARNRFNQENGQFDTRSSSEIPLSDLSELVRFVIKKLPEGMRRGIAPES
jgi:hypothetical protein